MELSKVSNRLRTAISLMLLILAGFVAAMMDFPDRGFSFAPPRQSSDDDRKSLGSLTELAQAVSVLQDQYAFQARLQPRRMLLAALTGIHDTFDYVLVRPAISLDRLEPDKGPLPDEIEITVRGKKRLFSVAKVDDIYQMTWKLMELFDFLSPADSVTEQKMEEAAIAGMLAILDPHTVYMTEQEYREMTLSTKGSFGGLGIVISVREGKLRVMSVMPGTPASKHDVKKGDHIVQIGEESTINLSVSEAANRLRGKPGTQITIRLVRGEGGKPREILLTREVIKVVSVLAKDLDKEIAYVHIKNFQQGTDQEVRQFLDRSYLHAPPRGIILDLRGNSGGVMGSATALADLFLGEGEIVTTVEKTRAGSEVERSQAGDRYEATPIVVLVDHASASASEIVTSALKYRDRALVMGKRTFGKGSVQFLQELTRGALKLTVAQYVGPGMEVIQGAGIEPHIELRAFGRNPKVRIPSFIDSFEGESALPFALEDTGALPVYDSPVAYLRYVPDQRTDDGEEVDYDEIVMDFPIRLAWLALASNGNESGGRMIEELLPLLQDVAEGEDYLVGRLASLEGKNYFDVDLPVSADIELHTRLVPPAPLAGEEATLEAVATNRGKEVLPPVYVRTESTNPRLDGRTCLLGNMEPGRTEDCSVKFKVPQAFPDRMDTVHVDLMTGMDIWLAGAETALRIRHGKDPRLAVNYRIDDRGGNGDGLVQVGESFEIVMEVSNIGNSDLLSGLAVVKNLSGAALFLSGGRAEITGIAPGNTRTYRFQAKAQKRPDHDEGWKIELGVVETEARRQFSTTQILPQVPPRQIVHAAFRGEITEVPLPVRIAADAQAPTWGAITSPGTVQVSARSEDWLQLQLPGRRTGWVQARAVGSETGLAIARFEETWVAIQPKVQIVSVSPSDLMGSESSMKLSGVVDYGRGHSPTDCGISLFNGNMKIAMLYLGDLSGEATALPFEFQFELEEGQNRVVLGAWQKNQSQGFAALYYNRISSAHVPVLP